MTWPRYVGRTPRATVPAGPATLHKGNRNHTGTGLSPATQALLPDWKPSPGGHLGYRAPRTFYPARPKQDQSTEPKFGRPCPGCGVCLPRAGRCASCWD